MIPCHGEHTYRMDADGFVAVFVDDHDGPAFDAVGREDGDLRLIDNGELQHRAVLPGVGDGERATDDIVGAQLLGTSAVARSTISRAIPRSRLVSALWMTGASKPSKLRSTAIATLMSWWTTSAPSPTDALICGNSRSASHNARTMNGR